MSSVTNIRFEVLETLVAEGITISPGVYPGERHEAKQPPEYYLETDDAIILMNEHIGSGKIRLL
jgi:hypothetical protein